MTELLIQMQTHKHTHTRKHSTRTKRQVDNECECVFVGKRDAGHTHFIWQQPVLASSRGDICYMECYRGQNSLFIHVCVFLDSCLSLQPVTYTRDTHMQNIVSYSLFLTLIFLPPIEGYSALYHAC